LRSPLIWPTGHKNLPPTYFLVAGADIWRDVGLIYEEILREENGIATKVDVFPGLPHGFFAMFPTADFVKMHDQKSEAGFEWLLEQSKK
jgi:acetyl esterase/lipase